ncbi:MAG TPA: metallophosphoesterase family protein [Bacteroidota bacterium]
MRTRLYFLMFSILLVAALQPYEVDARGAKVYRDPGGQQPPSVVRGPYLSCVTKNSAVISWTTSDACRGSVQFGTTSGYGSEIGDNSAASVHSLTLTGLKTNAQYHYRIIGDADTSSDYVFWTAPGKDVAFSFVVYGDTRSNHDAHVRVLRQIEKSAPRFVLNTGDLVARNTVYNWDMYFADLCDSTRVGETIPVYSTPGNHEAGQMYLENLFLPHNNGENTEEYYSFDYGSVHIISANSEIDYDPQSPQYRWLVKDLESPEATSAQFRIAIWHRPPYSSNNHGSDKDLRNTLGALMESHGVDIVFNGHDHCYERTKPIHGITYVVTGGGGAPLYDFKESNDWTACREKTHHFCNVEIDGSTLRMTMIRDDGSSGDSFIIDKNKTLQPQK